MTRKHIISQNTNAESEFGTDESLLAEFAILWERADKIWDHYDAVPEFSAYVSADYKAVFYELKKLKSAGAETFLEWGSGLGVVTIMASRMGFEAVGIEAELLLCDLSDELVEAFESDAKIAHGSFIPDAFVWDPAQGDESEKTSIDAADAYGDIDLDLSDFDVVYAYPWPTEHPLYHNILKEFGGANVILLTYDAREGVGAIRLNQDGSGDS